MKFCGHPLRFTRNVSKGEMSRPSNPKGLVWRIRTPATPQKYIFFFRKKNDMFYFLKKSNEKVNNKKSIFIEKKFVFSSIYIMCHFSGVATSGIEGHGRTRLTVAGSSRKWQNSRKWQDVAGKQK